METQCTFSYYAKCRCPLPRLGIDQTADFQHETSRGSTLELESRLPWSLAGKHATHYHITETVIYYLWTLNKLMKTQQYISCYNCCKPKKYFGFSNIHSHECGPKQCFTSSFPKRILTVRMLRLSNSKLRAGAYNEILKTCQSGKNPMATSQYNIRL